MADAPPRLDFVFQKYDPPLYLVTFNTWHRKKLLANDLVNSSFIMFARAAEKHQVAVGRYVIMPDHVHLFLRCGYEYRLTQWIRQLKRHLSKEIRVPRPHWQKGFFDHLVRHSESYAQKWNYLRDNPVRAGLMLDADDWPYQGDVVYINCV